MLSFDNSPLRKLIAVGRNKGLSIILSTQNMSDFFPGIYFAGNYTIVNFDMFYHIRYLL